MPNIPTRGQYILVDTPDSLEGRQGGAPKPQQKGQQIAGWVVAKVQPWEDHRNRGYQRLWSEYWRMWRGKWAPEDMTRQSERSRLIAPALAQAIDQTVSELEEAVFGKEVWFDIADDIQDPDRVDALLARDNLLEDFDTVNAKDAITEAILNAAIFGTGIVKLNTIVTHESTPSRDPNSQQLTIAGKDRVYVTVESIRPDEFIPDPSGKTVQEMLGVAHRVKRPMHSVLEKIEAGIYRKDALGLLFPSAGTDRGDEIDYNDPQAMNQPTDTDEVDIIEYHGKVPLKYLNDLMEAKTALDEILEADNNIHKGKADDGQLVEAIVTVANKSVLLRAMPNPFVLKDRSIIAFQFEKVPGRFWGRGVAEKGYNPQKALDAELRSRQDALGFISSPMVAVDSGRIPRGSKLEIKPGKVWTTQGPPADILMPVKIGEISASTFNQTDTMERMVQMGTGSFDTASALKSQSQSGANGVSSNSMMMGAFVKRAKRSLQQVDRNLLTPLVMKVMWRYMQFEPERYPQDYEFFPKTTLGLVAREVEAANMNQTMAMIPEQFGAVTLTLAQSIVEMGSSPNKAQIMKQINQALQPPSEEEQKKKQELAEAQHAAALAQLQGALLVNQKTIAEIKKLLAEAEKLAHQAGVEDDKVQLQVAELRTQLAELEEYRVSNQLQLKKLSQQDRALDQKDRELDIKQQVANKPKPATAR